MDDFEAAVLDVISRNITIESEWVGWDYDDAANELSLKIKLGDTVVASTSLRIQPVERSNDW